MASKFTNTDRSKNKTEYALYGVHIFGNGLKTIKDEFKHQVNTGWRPNVFVLDLEDLEQQLNNELHNANIKKDSKDNSNISLIHVLITRIQEILLDKENYTKKINDQSQFDLYEYWLKQNPIANNNKLDKTNIVKSAKDTAIAKRKENPEMCSGTLIVKEHNRVGHYMLLNKRKYIRDEPALGKLYIIILGQMSKSFLMHLLRKNQPVEAIINFVPAESSYYNMLGNDSLRNFILSTLADINNSSLNLRQEIILKPVGLFTQSLPVISSCLAKKNCREIFDQLTWCVYDVDVLKYQYENYYFKPFQVTNVEIPANANITQLYHVAESLNTQGRFQKCSMPASEADLASIAGYLNSLLNTCGIHEDGVTETGQTNLLLPKALSTVINISKFDRLVVAENNNLLLNMLKYADLNDFNAIYLCCRYYNELGKFAISPQRKVLINVIKGYTRHHHQPQLPQYVKFYANEECSWQRLTELRQEYGEHEVRKFSDGYKLHIFTRTDYVLKESENCFVIPTRLCFRDFTLFQKEEFLRDLKTPMHPSNMDHEYTTMAIEDEKNIFIRPNSLKDVMLQNQSKEVTANPKRESRSKRKSEKESSFSKPATASEETPGLPAGHHLLQGYNFNDTLQEIECKTSVYNFLHGRIKLYEEKWCLQEMNKQLSLTIHNTTLFFSGTRNIRKGISNNLRFVTKDNISINILDIPNENYRVVMNYPNSLSVYQQTNYCEQIWHCDKTPRDEQKRIQTNFGAIIVFFKSQDLIIMRYNGEIYRLYQHDLQEEEESEDIQTNSSQLTENKFQKQKLQGRKNSRHTTESKQSKKLYSEESIETYSSSKSATSNSNWSLNFELNFFNFICSIYGLTYFCFSITTSRGQVINVTQQGEFSERHPCSINEWFDYFANEAYCERSDGVKMIWSQNSFKCFHEDGTVFTTTIEDFEVPESPRTPQSSFQEEFLEQTETSYLQETFKTMSFSSELTSAVNGIAYSPYNVPFVQIKCQDICMHHPNYAQVFIQELDSLLPNLQIFAANGIRIFTQLNKEECNDDDDDFMEYKSNRKLMINVWIHDKLKVKVDSESCQVYAIMSNKTEAESDSLRLSLKYTDNINDAFSCWMKEIDSSRTNAEHEVRELYFMEKINYDASIRGFEFFSILPTTSAYKYRMSNNIIELKGLNTINQTMLYSSKENEEDLKKFPRFKQREKEKYFQNTESELPASLSANVFIQIPQQLRNSKNITKFLEPFESICFKRLRRKLTEALNCYLKPQQQQNIKMLCSRINWEERIWRHGRRLFNEKQRSGLYIAMIKHETYPNYWKFSQTYRNDVRCIEFFDFVHDQCNCISNRKKYAN